MFAVWAVREPAVSRDLADGLRAARESGLKRLPEWIDHRPEFTREFRRAYLGGHIRYGLGGPEKAGIERFRRELDTHIRPSRPSVAPCYV